MLSIPSIQPHITFKGGTSLSKAYNIINRFSEDIDLTIDKEVLIANKRANPAETGISGKESERRIKALRSSAQEFV